MSSTYPVKERFQTMSSLPILPAAVKPLRFVVGPSQAYIWGAEDAAKGLPCVPEMQWVRRADQRDYVAGWASVKGHNQTTRYFLGGNS
jgi:hypothetical protein